MKLSVPFVLASRSPRRRLLLATFGIPFDVRSADIDEQMYDQESPEDTVRRLALEKAGVVSNGRPDALVLGADTIVLLDGQVLGKPDGFEQACETLRLLSGRRHRVLTGIALVAGAGTRISTAVESTLVTFANLNETEIEHYARLGSPLDKAGAYGIQDDRGALFISGIEGDFYNVVGLPLHRLYRLLKDDFSDLFSGAT